MACVIGVDVGGTYTDAVIIRDKEVLSSCKHVTTANRTEGIIKAIEGTFLNLKNKSQIDNIRSTLARVCIGTTHFINAVIERSADKLTPVAVVRLCGTASIGIPPFSDFPSDLAQIIKASTHMISGGLDYNCAPIQDLCVDEIQALAKEFLGCSPPVKNVVISGTFSPMDNPENNQEKQAADIFLSVSPEFSITLASKIGKLGLIERENAAILNESLKTFAKCTISEFQNALENLNLNCPFYLTQNDGTLISVADAVEYPVFTFSSGPTNSMRGAMFLSGKKNGIVVDIGGTSTDVGILVNGFPREASSQVKIGGVRTNFQMPNVVSVGLGGGSLITRDKNDVLVGPSSVGLQLTTKALSFGGDICTASDVAIAAGICKDFSVCGRESLIRQIGSIIYPAMRNIHLKLEEAIDLVKTHQGDALVLLVGGGSILMDTKVSLKGASRIIVPPHFEVANAVGASLGMVAGRSECVENLSNVMATIKSNGSFQGSEDELRLKAREVIIQRSVDSAIKAAQEKGCIPGSEIIYEKSIMNVTYVPDALSAYVKVIGSLSEQSTDTISNSKTEKIKESSSDKVVSSNDGPKENAVWPFQSVKEKTLDEEANLPSPQIDEVTGEWILNLLDVECISIGAGILGCGGGGDPNLGRIMATGMINDGKQIRVVDPLKLNGDQFGLAAAVAFMGAPLVLNEKLINGLESTRCLHVMQNILASGLCTEENHFGKILEKDNIKLSTRKLENGHDVWIIDHTTLPQYELKSSSIPLANRITGMISAEIGGCNSFEPLVTGARVGLPVLDADGMGRAFPELQMFLPFINGLPPFPSCVADEKGNKVAISHVSSANDLEDVFRSECLKMGMICAVCIPPMTLSEVLNTCILHSLSRAWQLGRAVYRAKRSQCNVIEAIITQQQGLLLLTGKVVDVNRKSEAAFTGSISIIKGTGSFSNYTIQITTKNENIDARKVNDDGSIGDVLAITPDLITVVDSDTGYPITTEDIRYGLRVSVLVLPADFRLLTEKALPVVGPQGFQINDVKYCKPKSLCD